MDTYLDERDGPRFGPDVSNQLLARGGHELVGQHPHEKVGVLHALDQIGHGHDVDRQFDAGQIPARKPGKRHEIN